jgi:hypothetical protein
MNAHPYDYVGAALKALGPIDAVYYNWCGSMVIQLMRPPSTWYERACLKGAMLRAGSLVQKWHITCSPDPWNETFLTIRFRGWDRFERSLTCADLRPFRDALGLRFRWYARIVGPLHQSHVALNVGELGHGWGDPTEIGPGFDEAVLRQITGVAQICADGPTGLVVTAKPRHDIIVVMRSVCEAVNAYLDLDDHTVTEYDGLVLP